MDRKRQRIGQEKLQELVCLRNISLSSLQRVLNSISDDGDGVSWRQLQAAGRHRYEQVKHTMHLPAEADGEVVLNMAHPMKLFDLLVQENQHLRSWFEEAWRSSPSSPSRPWQLLMGWDEFVPGNKLAFQNSRMTIIWSSSFLELCQHMGRDVA